jgi:hypothetical protein
MKIWATEITSVQGAEQTEATMADEVARVVESGETADNPSGVSECLVNLDRAVTDWGFGRVDNPEDISQSLVRQILPKCRPLDLALTPPGETWGKAGYGHGGFIRREAIQSSTSPGGNTATQYSVFPVTAKHNLRRVWDRHGREYRPTLATFRIKSAYVSVDSPDLDWAPFEGGKINLRHGVDARPAFCPWGLDISVGPLISNSSHPAVAPQLSFEKVRNSFIPKIGHKVGIAALFDEDTKPTKETVAGAYETEVDISTTDIARIYGKPGKVNIYTGTINYVGVTHIEYDINTFTGCSGAVVFLLDQNQPEDSVRMCDFGAAVAIHSGAHPSMGDRNFGFMLNSSPFFDY